MLERYQLFAQLDDSTWSLAAKGDEPNAIRESASAYLQSYYQLRLFIDGREVEVVDFAFKGVIYEVFQYVDDDWEVIYANTCIETATSAFEDAHYMQDGHYKLMANNVVLAVS